MARTSNAKRAAHACIFIHNIFLSNIRLRMYLRQKMLLYSRDADAMHTMHLRDAAGMRDATLGYTVEAPIRSGDGLPRSGESGRT